MLYEANNVVRRCCDESTSATEVPSSGIWWVLQVLLIIAHARWMMHAGWWLDDESAHHPGRASVIPTVWSSCTGTPWWTRKNSLQARARKHLEKWFVLMHLLLECLNAVISSYTCCTCSWVSTKLLFMFPWPNLEKCCLHFCLFSFPTFVTLPYRRLPKLASNPRPMLTWATSSISKWWHRFIASFFPFVHCCC